MDDLRGLLAELESRPLIVPDAQRRRLPKAVSRFIRRKIEELRAEGKYVKQAVTMAYQMAKRRGLL